ncbi:MAG: hypothetical protein ABSH01_25125 [Terriglobia bacterium]|jgi:hypothetical protein
MPLLKGRSRKTIRKNFHELRHGKTFSRTRKKFGKRKAQKQMIAIALSTARKSGKRKKAHKR